MINVAVLGYGTVGSGVVELIEKNREKITKGVGDEIHVKKILDVRDFSSSPYADRFVNDFSLIENDPEIRVVVETIGGVGVAQEFTRRALTAGKSVVTSNKELVSEFGWELLALGAEHHASYLFEASVGGGVPILHPISACLAGDELDEVYGIVNGTTNYILAQMIQNGLDFGTALRQAQENGYAEHDPTADIEGIDTCRKICILADMSFGKNIRPAWVRTQGITDIDRRDIDVLAPLDAHIKLIGRTLRREDGLITAYVAPHVLLKENLLAHVNDVFNGIVVKGGATGETMFYGKGAGKLPTATAVVSDIAESVRRTQAGAFPRWDMAGEEIFFDPDELTDRWYIRANLDADEAAVLFSDVTILSSDEGGTAFLTGPMSGIALAEKLEAVDASAVYRVLE